MWHAPRVSDADAVILVGGLGARLRPLTLSTPKPMLPAAGVPLLAHLVARIRDAGLTHVVLGTSYRADVFQGTSGTGPHSASSWSTSSRASRSVPAAGSATLPVTCARAPCWSSTATCSPAWTLPRCWTGITAAPPT
jgi:CTP:molybdopterin cytidylyltransferase MocA